VRTQKPFDQQNVQPPGNVRATHQRQRPVAGLERGQQRRDASKGLVRQCRAATAGQENQLDSPRLGFTLTMANLFDPLVIASHSQVCTQAVSDSFEQSLHLSSCPKAIMHDQDA
jgi:hypothetical protein